MTKSIILSLALIAIVATLIFGVCGVLKASSNNDLGIKLELAASHSLQDKSATATISFNCASEAVVTTLGGQSYKISPGQLKANLRFIVTGVVATLNFDPITNMNPIISGAKVVITTTGTIHQGTGNDGAVVFYNAQPVNWMMDNNMKSGQSKDISIDMGAVNLGHGTYTAEIAITHTNGGGIVSGDSPANSSIIFTTFHVE